MPVVIVAIYAIVLILGVSISGYLSYEGLLKTAKEVTPVLVVFIMAVILMADMTISYFRTTERKYGYVVVVWCIAAFVSIGSNFNFLYSNFMRDDVTEATVAEQIQTLRDDLVETRVALISLEAMQFASEMQADLRAELDNLRSQINDPLRPGCGEECRSHMTNVERILGKQITNLAVPSIGSDSDVVEDWFNRYSAAAIDMLNTSLSSTQYPALEHLLNRIDGLLLEYDSSSRILANKGGLDALPRMSALSFDIEREANALLPEDKKVNHTYIDSTLGRLGEIVYAFENGFGAMPNPMATFTSLFFASIIDILPFFLSFVLFGKGRLEKNVKTGVPRNAGGRRIVT